MIVFLGEEAVIARRITVSDSMCWKAFLSSALYPFLSLGTQFSYHMPHCLLLSFHTLRMEPTSGTELDTDTLQSHNVSVQENNLSSFLGMKAGVHFSGDFLCIGCILRIYFYIVLRYKRMLNQNNQPGMESNIYFFSSFKIGHCYKHWGYHGSIFIFKVSGKLFLF